MFMAAGNVKPVGSRAGFVAERTGEELARRRRHIGGLCPAKPTRHAQPRDGRAKRLEASDCRACVLERAAVREQIDD
jgi:hypothetical protein